MAKKKLKSKKGGRQRKRSKTKRGKRRSIPAWERREAKKAGLSHSAWRKRRNARIRAHQERARHIARTQGDHALMDYLYSTGSLYSG